MNIFNVNLPLGDLISRDPGLDEETKELFVILHSAPESNVAKIVNQFCQLFKRNYVWIEGYPPPPVFDRSKWANRKRALKVLVTGEL